MSGSIRSLTIAPRLIKHFYFALEWDAPTMFGFQLVIYVIKRLLHQETNWLQLHSFRN